MAIAHHDFEESAATGTTGDIIWSYTPTAGTLKGAVVLIDQDGTGDHVTSVTYGAASMSRIRMDEQPTGPDEVMATYVYFLGSGIPAGTQTITVDVDATLQDRHALVAVVTADAATTTIDVSNGTGFIDVTDPSLTLNYTDGLADWVGYYVLLSGVGAPVTTVQAGSVHMDSVDLGAVCGMYANKEGTGGNSTTMGYTLAANDGAHSGVIVKEVVAADIPATTSAAITFTATATATREVLASVTTAIAATSTVTAVVGRAATANVSVNFISTVAATRDVQAIATSAISFDATVTASTDVLAITSAPLAFIATASATVEHIATADVIILFDASASAASVAEIQVLATTQLLFNASATAASVAEIQALTAVSLSFTSQVTSIVEHSATATTAILFDSQVVAASGALAFANIIFAATATAIIDHIVQVTSAIQFISTATATTGAGPPPPDPNAVKISIRESSAIRIMERSTVQIREIP